MTGKPRMAWTDSEIELLRECHAAGMTAEEAAASMGRSTSSVGNRAKRLGIPFKRPKTYRKSELTAEGHRPLTDRCGEILRQHGWRI